MLLLLLIAVLTAVAAFLLFKFATVVDGDLTLVSRGPPRRDRVDGKVVWITGASRGIGEVLAMQFANLGAKLILSARTKDELERVKKNILSKNPDSRVEVLPMDLSAGEESLKEVVHVAESFFSNAGVDYMIHNAAFERPKRGALEESEEGLKATLNVNVFGTITLTRLLAPYMLDRGTGHFVVMSSAAGKVPAPGQAIYSASKHALNGYFASLRSELCTKGIKVTVVCPGPIETPQSSAAASQKREKRVSVERCVELTIIAATHGLKEAWISYQPVLTVMYLVQYMPTVGYWLMDKVGAKRLDAAAKKGNTYSWNLIFGSKKSA
ncbi:dehydrogenase/reductase SDR family member 7 isoform X2 [Sorghum bicolor]|uniref:dehydrogenase/reductase SDR family member 7 isoform X2 n=1 Tax=Sorghum bicolor TaxID=4558 RepID=UPI000B424166|nr:dehydrogenase/reductase SDR family member 7 isoform X2 [Sorghum bicolor]|eukprot:XP_021317183.1 dehydrogenase/reductase SDR family member 7 isoform X2 [Sorghum bicolor]